MNKRIKKTRNEDMYRAILTLEDGALKGGLFSAVCEWFAGKDGAPLIKGAGIPDRFIGQDTQKAQRAECGLDMDSILDLVIDMMKIL